MSLNAQLTKMKQERTAKRAPAAQKLLDEEAKRVAQLGLVNNSLTVGHKAPTFTLTNTLGKHITSSDLLVKGPVVISFYRGAWCPYCNVELNALQKTLPQIQAAGGQLVAISPNLPDKSLSSVEKHNLTFEVLSDVDNKVARQFGLVFSLGEDLRPMFKKVGFDVPAHDGNDTWEIPVPATYIVNSEGTIIYSFVNVDYTQRAEPEEIVQILQSENVMI